MAGGRTVVSNDGDVVTFLEIHTEKAMSIAAPKVWCSHNGVRTMVFAQWCSHLQAPGVFSVERELHTADAILDIESHLRSEPGNHVGRGPPA